MRSNGFNAYSSEKGTSSIGSGGLVNLSEQTISSQIESPPEYDYPIGRTMSNTESPKHFRNETFPIQRAMESAFGEMDKALLSRAENILEGFNVDDPVASVVDLESLRGVVFQLWETASKCSEFHQDILAILENALLSIERPEKKHLSLFREAIKDLEMDILTRAHVDIIHHQFIADGFSPLTLFTDLNEHDDSQQE